MKFVYSGPKHSMVYYLAAPLCFPDVKLLTPKLEKPNLKRLNQQVIAYMYTHYTYLVRL